MRGLRTYALGREGRQRRSTRGICWELQKAADARLTMCMLHSHILTTLTTQATLVAEDGTRLEPASPENKAADEAGPSGKTVKDYQAMVHDVKAQDTD